MDILLSTHQQLIASEKLRFLFRIAMQERTLHFAAEKFNNGAKKVQFSYGCIVKTKNGFAIRYGKGTGANIRVFDTLTDAANDIGLCGYVRVSDILS